MTDEQFCFINTTACYIRANGTTLMFQRITNDAMYQKWIVPGGKCEGGESPEECVVREVQEEVGLTLLKVNLRGIITFARPATPQLTVTTFLFESFHFEGEVICANGENFQWVADDKITELDIPSSDHLFLPWIYHDARFFSAKIGDDLQAVSFYPQ